ncbi:hypothetical protein Ahy_B08g089911 isoform E [Arachis hypogaea]|uniref:Uncharacterized protein n=1 Tax=Arachis hypogaea TaxID=3818 RepID=A0A444XZ61_ARAHY|nr:hypothetical protein Ahy_B08g089911 isoform E [Arachis hypogaea]
MDVPRPKRKKIPESNQHRTKPKIVPVELEVGDFEEKIVEPNLPCHHTNLHLVINVKRSKFFMLSQETTMSKRAPFRRMKNFPYQTDSRRKQRNRANLVLPSKIDDWALDSSLKETLVASRNFYSPIIGDTDIRLANGSTRAFFEPEACPNRIILSITVFTGYRALPLEAGARSKDVSLPSLKMKRLWI